MTDPYAPSYPPQPPSGTPAEQWKPAEADRQQIAERLAQAVDEGRLNLIEYDQRLRASEGAKTFAELERVVEDLPAPSEPVLVQIGELAVTASTVHTPTGPIPLRGSQWTIQDQWQTDQKIPTWAVAVAVVGFFCIGPFSLLFLLAKESHFRGNVQVAVANGARQYVAYLPVHGQQQVQYAHQQVNYVRSIAIR